MTIKILFFKNRSYFLSKNSNSENCEEFETFPESTFISDLASFGVDLKLEIDPDKCLVSPNESLVLNISSEETALLKLIMKERRIVFDGKNGEKEGEAGGSVIIC